MYPEGATPSGIQDLAGNVLEWAGSNAVRGGAWNLNAWNLRASYRYVDGPEGRNDYLGFRCVRESLSL
jgi:serine/threonine-protein kinase